MTNCAEAARGPDEQRLVDVASILAAGISRLRERQSLPAPKQVRNPGDSSAGRLELPGETVLSVVHRDYLIAQLNGDETAAQAYRQAYYEANDTAH